MDYQGKQNESNHNKEQKYAAQDQRNHVMPGIFDPTCGKGERSRNSNQHGQADEHRENKKKLPHEVAQPSTMTASPSAPDFAALRDHAVKQDEAHDAAHVEEHDPQNHGHHDQHGDQ